MNDSPVDPAPPPHPSPRNLIVLSDGTGNSSAKLFKTNVWRLYEALDLKCPDQLALYDDGVGTAALAPLAVLGGAFGWGLKRNVLDLYTFLCRNYRDGDRIFAFGFSRGAFTARVVAALVAHEGLVDASYSAAEIERLAKWAYRSYRDKRFRGTRAVRALRVVRNVLYRALDKVRGRTLYEQAARRRVGIDFLGLWDTVAAYGLPLEELTRGWDQWVWPLTPADHSLHDGIRCARHALSLNDERQTFFPLLIDEHGQPPAASTDEERITQVWFAGVHADVGGGYPDDALALTPLLWMASEAKKRGLRFMSHLNEGSPGAIPALWLERSTPCAPAHDSRKGVAAYYRYHPRPVARLCHPLGESALVDTAKIHESVFERIRDSGDRYAPFNLPERYRVVTPTGTILGEPGGPPNPYERDTDAHTRANGQEAAWNHVWWRRILYFSTLVVTLSLAVLPYTEQWKSLPAFTPSKTVAVLQVVASFLPSFAATWLNLFATNPLVLLAGLGLLALLMRASTVIDWKIQTSMREVWKGEAFVSGETGPAIPTPTDWLYRLRENAVYRHTLRFLSHTFWPTVFGLSILAILLVVLPLRSAYLVARTSGAICRSDSPVTKAVAMGSGKWSLALSPGVLCQRTDLTIEAGSTYRIQVALPQACPGEPCNPEEPACRAFGSWRDGKYPVNSARGFSSLRAPVFAVFAPTRRMLTEPWLKPIAAIGEHVPEQHPIGESAIFTAGRSGPLSLYVNDAVVPWPDWDAYYKNNYGAPADVWITKLASDDLSSPTPLPQPVRCPPPTPSSAP
jgi:uncharacterized protein (DUF2235 family)